MKVDLKITPHSTLKKDDLLICNGDNTFVPTSKEELLKDANRKINDLENELKVVKQFLKVYQGETTKLLKGVINNG